MIAVQLTNASGRPLRERNVLVAVNLLSGGRYYYGNLIGLTDSRGYASTTRETLEREFYRDRASFPMDYKLELIECDNNVELVLLSREEIQKAQAAIEQFGDVDSAVVSAYARARNQLFAPAMARFCADSEDDQPLIAALTTEHLQMPNEGAE